MASFNLFQSFMVLILFWLGSSSSSPTENIFQSPPLFPSPLKNMSFSIPLIHYNSPQSPFHNPHKTDEDLIKENVLASLARNIYFSSGMLNITGATSKYVRAPIGNNFLAKYSIGTPPVDAWGFMDTGSNFIWLECQPCKACPSQPPPFNPSKSSTYKPLPCGPLCSSLPTYVISHFCSSNSVCAYLKIYRDDYTVTTGVVSLETLHLTQNDTTHKIVLDNIVFGCGAYNKGLKSVPGVIGLGNNQFSMVGQLSQTAFSYLTTGNHNNPSGWLNFGISVENPEVSPLLTTPDGRYFLSIEGISVDDDDVKIPEGVFNFFSDGSTGFMIDTGTPYTLLQEQVFDDLAKILRDDIGFGHIRSTTGFDVCFDDIGFMPDHSPEIVFKLTGYGDFPLSYDNTWIQTNGLICLAMLRAPANLSILGMYQQHGVTVAFDLAKNTLFLQYYR